MDSSRREEAQGGRVERVCLGVALDVGDPCGDWERRVDALIGPGIRLRQTTGMTWSFNRQSALHKWV
jgi:hypothetical protein